MKSKKTQDLINEIVKLTAGKTLPHWKVIERAEDAHSQLWEDIWEDSMKEINNKMKGKIK